MQRNKNLLFIMVSAAIIALVSFQQASGLNVPYEEQAKDNWCWTASMDMVLQFCSPYLKEWYYDNQNTLATYAFDGHALDQANYLGGSWGSDHKNWLTCEEIYRQHYMVDMDVKTYGRDDANRQYSDAVSEISEGEPIHAVMPWHLEDHHVVIIDAYTNNEERIMVVHDPYGGDYGGDHLKKFENGLDGWATGIRHFSIIAGFDVGVHDDIIITSAPDTVTPHQQVAFYADFHDVGEFSCVSEIEWELRFFYNGPSQEYTYVTNWMTNSGMCISTNWEDVYIPSSSMENGLASDYNWEGYTEGSDVYVKGEVRVRVTDTDGYSHMDKQTVWFKNPGVSLIPLNAYLEDKTAEGGDYVEIESHEYIGIGDVTFESGSHGEFSSGEEIVVVPETRLERGSEVHLQIDASLKE